MGAWSLKPLCDVLGGYAETTPVARPAGGSGDFRP